MSSAGRVAFVLSILVVVSCGGGTTSGSGDVRGEVADAASDGTGAADLVVAPDTGPKDPGDPDPGSGDLAAADLAGEDGAEVDAGPRPGEPGATCETNDDCMSGFCLEATPGWQCPEPCSGGQECPAGYSCVQVATYPDVTFACADLAPRTCRPCVADADCVAGFVPTVMTCTDLGGFSFCLRACSDALPCPEGFACDGRDGAAGACRPDSGTCDCLPKYAAAGTQGRCTVSNQHGVCAGEFACTDGGIGTCSAASPAAEACNGADDDCDGSVDDGLDGLPCGEGSGSCQARTVCVGGHAFCEPPPEVPETCNGADDDCDGSTDEEFPDLDGDGTPDCTDTDDDGDGVPDTLDDCPAKANPGQEDLDLDGLGDACDDDVDGDGALAPADCDDRDLAIHPGATETCNDRDDDCNGTVDEGFPDTDGDGLKDCADEDDDGDGVPDDQDNCPLDPNPDQQDPDLDGKGMPCDPEDDGDGVPDATDNCPLVANADQADLDSDGLGDACDPDDDGDGVPDATDVCPAVANADQADADHDGVGDPCDSDDDNDGVPDATDNCPLVANADQAECGKDKLGDACDPDDDDDGALDAVDCAPCDASVYPGADETCDGVDENCNGLVDEGAAEACHPYACAGADGCAQRCGEGLPCAEGWWCDPADEDGNGRTDECAKVFPAGSACKRADQCADGQCTNGHCCGAAGESCCGDSSDCSALDAPASCDAPSSCKGHHVEGTCDAAHVCRAKQVADVLGCTGALCAQGNYCDGAAVRGTRYCDAGGACAPGAVVQNCQGSNTCCSYGCSGGVCYANFNSGDLGCVLACAYNTLFCICF